MRYIVDNDLHIHSEISLCSRDPEQSNERILKYAIDNGLKTVCVTDHFWDEKVVGASEWYSKQGYEISVVGESENTARYIGINVKKVIIRTMIISGALCGVAGFLLVAGSDHSIASDTIGGRGFTAIMVSWLAKFNPITMILTSFIIVFMERGAGQVATALGLNHAFSDIIAGIIIFFIIGCEFFINYEIKFRAKEVKSK